MPYFLSHEVRGLILINKLTRVGRKDAEVLFSKDENMSGTHFELKMVKDKLYIKDLKSKNGTSMNNEKLDPNTEYIVFPGSILEAGDQKFKIIFK